MRVTSGFTGSPEVLFNNAGTPYKTLVWKGKKRRYYLSKKECASCGKIVYVTRNNVRKKPHYKSYCSPYCRSKGQSGINNRNWSGGRKLKRGDHGYVMLYAPDHPQADKTNYVYEHRIVVERHIGRFLSRDEYVHHVDLDQNNNDISNLVVVDKKQHAALHWQLNQLVAPLIRKGLLVFNANAMRYELAA